MRQWIRLTVAVLVAAFASVALSPVGRLTSSFARGGGAGAGAGGTGPGKKGKDGAKDGLKGGSPLDYLEECQREEAEANLLDFLFEGRYRVGQDASDDDRDAGLAAARQKASKDRRDATEDASHPL
jgi:hypothetical protein